MIITIQTDIRTDELVDQFTAHWRTYEAHPDEVGGTKRAEDARIQFLQRADLGMSFVPGTIGFADGRAADRRNGGTQGDRDDKNL